MNINKSEIRNPKSKIVIGLDIGGTKILAAAATEDGELLNRIREETPVALDEGLALLKALVQKLAAGKSIAAIGAAIGGPLDWEKGIVSPVHQPQWRNIPLKEIMETAFNSPFLVDVDTNVAALGEYRFGGVQSDRMLYITISTGMGGGFLIDGEIYRGKNGAHPEVGHQAINYRCAHPERIICDCGAKDCLEALISGSGIRRIYEKQAEALSDTEWEEVGFNLGQGLRNIAAIYAPEIIILSGGVSTGAGEKLLQPAREVLQNSLKIVPIPEIQISNLGYDSALMGTIALALNG